MKTPDFTKAAFLGAYLETKDLKPFKNEHGRILPEIALVGRSNVGKSSLINSLTQKKGLAKTSATPGKTQTINFFNIDDTFILVDLPGYGYAISDKEKKELWGKHLDHFLKTRKTLKALFLLIDVRREMTDEDLAMLEFCKHMKFETILIFTKIDKVKAAECSSSVEKNLAIAQTVYGKPIEYILFTIKEGSGRHALIKKTILFR